MANDVTNIIKFENIPQSKVTEIMEQIKNEREGIGSIDFNKIIPMPDNIYKGDIEGKAYQKYGKNNWIDWSVEFWGTKCYL